MKNDLGQMKVVQVRPSYVRLFYSKLSKQKYAHNTIKYIHNMISPRMAETDLDIKVVQYVMGHADISVTMDVYNHVTDQERIIREIAKLDEV